jgi:hypothetical protein
VTDCEQASLLPFNRNGKRYIMCIGGGGAPTTHEPTMNVYTATAEQLEAAISLNRKWMHDHANEEGTQRFQKTLEFSQLMSDQLLSLRLTA